MVIPTFNRAKYISEAIDSVLNQTYKDFEITVVDDGSTDNTKEVLSPYMDRIKYVCQENKGCASARNLGIRNSEGDYLVFLDADDLLEPKKLEVQVPILENNPEVGFVYSDGYDFAEGDKSKFRLNPAIGRNASSSEFARLFFFNTNVYFTSTLIRRKCLEDVGFFDETLSHHEDGDMLLCIALKWEVRFSNYPSVKQRHHSARKSSNRVGIYEALIKSSEKILRLCPDFKKVLGKEADNRIADLHYLLAQAYIRDRKFNEAKRELDAYFSSCKSVVWKARLYKLILQTSHPSTIFNWLSLIRRSAKILIKLKSYLKFKNFLRIVQ